MKPVLMMPALLVSAVLMTLAACVQVEPRPAGFGPPTAAPLPFGKHYTGEPERMPPPLLPSESRLDTAGLAFTQTRLDPLDPQLQHYEVQLVSVPSAQGRPEGVAAAWMTGRPQPDGSTLTRLAVAYSTEGGRSFLPLAVPFSAEEAAIQFDPTLAFDTDAQRLLVGVMEQTSTRRNLWLARSQQGAPESMLPGREVDPPTLPYVDKGWLATGVDTQGRPVQYLTDVNGVRVSRDAGASWSTARPLPNAFNLIQPLVLSDGRLFISYLGLSSGSSSQVLFVQGPDETALSPALALHDFNVGLAALTGEGIPGGFRVAPTPVVAESPRDGRLFFVVHDGGARRPGSPSEVDIDLILRISEDGGRSWGAARNVSAGLDPFADQFMAWLQVDAAGRLHLVYFETPADSPGDLHARADVHVWYARSADDGQSWARTRLTTQPIPSGQTRWSPVGNVPDAQFIGDYLGLVIGEDAAFAAHPVFDGSGFGMAVSRIPLPAAQSTGPANPLALAGLWYEPATSGQGFQIGWIEGGVLTVMFFGHRDSGENLFLTGTLAQTPRFGETLRIPIQQARGGRFNGLDPTRIERSSWGEMELRFESCDRAAAVLRGADGVQSLQLQRIGRPPGVVCP
jgi:hypothetical protein